MLALHHLAILVSDLARAEAFYVGVLGLPVARRWTDDHGAARSLWLTLGGGAFLAIELASRERCDSPRRRDDAPGLHCAAFGIERADRERQCAHLAAAGFPVERATAYTIYVRDPDGNLIALSHYPEPASDTDPA